MKHVVKTYGYVNIRILEADIAVPGMKNMGSTWLMNCAQKMFAQVQDRLSTHQMYPRQVVEAAVGKSLLNLKKIASTK